MPGSIFDMLDADNDRFSESNMEAFLHSYDLSKVINPEAKKMNDEICNQMIYLIGQDMQPEGSLKFPDSLIFELNHMDIKAIEEHFGLSLATHSMLFKIAAMNAGYEYVDEYSDKYLKLKTFRKIEDYQTCTECFRITEPGRQLFSKLQEMLKENDVESKLAVKVTANDRPSKPAELGEVIKVRCAENIHVDVQTHSVHVFYKATGKLLDYVIKKRIAKRQNG